MRIGTAAFAAALLSTTCMASADNLDQLQAMKSTGTPMAALKPIPQGGNKAAAINKTLEKIKLPAGFKISLYALVPDARMLAVGPQGVVTFVSTRKDKIYSMKDSTASGVADEVKEFAPTVAKKNPNAICFSKDGFLFSAEQNRVMIYPGAEFFYETPDVAAGTVVKEGDLIPKEEESFNHSARTCRVGPDNKLYVSLGQPFNVPPVAKQDLYYKAGIGGIVRMDRDGSNREVYAHGIRNSVGMDFDPKDKSLWFTDNQVDGMGDDTPPGELNHITKPGQNFGFPWYGGGQRPHGRVQGPDPAGRRRVPGRRDGAPRGRPRHEFLPRRHVPGAVQGRDLLGPARLLEPHGAGGRPRDGHHHEAGRHRHHGALRRGLARRGRILPRPPGRRGADARWLAAGVGRLRGRGLPHHLRPVRRQVRR